MAFRGTQFLEKSKEYETEMLKAYILEILADEQEHRLEDAGKNLSDLPGTKTHA